MPSSFFLRELNAFEIPFPRPESTINSLSGFVSSLEVLNLVEPDHSLEIQLAEGEAELQHELRTESEIIVALQSLDLDLPELQDPDKVAD